MTKVIVSFMLLSILNQVIAPTVAFALTSGPTSPEATSFEPIDTTDMVNPLTGDFTYNLPLLEVPGPEGGYPLSLSYHAGIQPNEDASWVGLGWTLNPGAITRSVNGFPDDWSGSNISRRDYWSGGTQTTYNIGVSVGLPGNVANVGFGLSFSQDTYRGFGVGMNIGVGVGLGESGFGLNLGIGVSPFGDPYASTGVSFSGKGSDGVSASVGIGVATNFESISVNGNAGIGYSSGKQSGGSLLGASISSDGTGPSFSVGGISSSTSNSKAGTIKTESSGFSFGMPIFPGVNINLGYSKIRYWSDETSNTSIIGSLRPVVFSAGGNQAFDNYALLDSEKNIVLYPDPGKVQGGAFPDFDVYSVSSQGLSGNMRPYNFQDQVFSQDRKDANNNYLIKYFKTRTFGSLMPEAKFRFINDFSNSYRQTYPDYASANVDLKTTEPPFDGNPQYGWFTSYNNNLIGSKSIQYYTKDVNGNMTQAGFLKPKVAGLDRSLHRSDNRRIEGFKITNTSGVTYHYNLPAFSYNEEVYQEKIGGNSSNRQMRTEGYAYTWYLTSITGPDYVDRNNDQTVNEGDWGYWMDFEYGKWCDDYVWRNPSEGFHRDEDHEFQNVSMGKKEIYYLNAVRTRSHIAIFEKEIRLDARGASPSIFNKAAQNRYQYSNGLFDDNSAKSMRLNKIYLLNASDATLVTSTSSGTGFYANVLDKDDIIAVGRNNVEAKAIRVIDFNYNYNLCKGTANSFGSPGSAQKTGKLTLSSLNFRGAGGANLTPPVEFEYEPSGNDLKTVTGTLSSNSGSNTFISSDGKFEPGDLIETDEPDPTFCGVVVSKVQNGTSYTYTFKNSRFSGGPVTKQLRNTKNPPYNRGAYDMWGMYKSDYESSSNENISRITTELSNKSTDAWCLRKIKTNMGSEVDVKYEGDTYNRSVLNKNLSLIISDFAKIDESTRVLTINSFGHNLNALFKIGDVLDFMILTHLNELINGYSYQKFDVLKSALEAEGSKPYITNMNGNQLTIKVSHSLGVKMNEYRYSGFEDTEYELLTGNLKVSGGSRFYGGGLRVKSIAVDDILDNVNQTNYSYSIPETQNSSGVTSYEPAILDIDDAASFGQKAKEAYRKHLYADISVLYSIAREVPSPGVMYEYVTVQNEIHRSGQSNPSPVDGKTVYQYEVFRDNMIGRVEASPPRTGTANGKSQYTKNIVLKKFIGALGALKKITRYDVLNKKLNETINHYLHDGLENLPLTDFMTQYEQRLSQFFYQGLLKERYSEVKEVRESDGSYTVRGTFSAKEDYPAVPLGQSSKNYITGLESGSENIAFDFYSGGLTKILQKDAYGNRFLTEIEPAYRKYGDMGPKDKSSMHYSYSNMLSQEASRTTYKVNAANQYLGVVSASAQTWSNTVMVDDENGDPTTDGQTNIWRSKGSYQWMMTGTSANNITPIGLFTPFNHAGTNSPSWKKTAEITRYNVYSAGLEATDINNHYAASKMGYKNSMVTVTASPARHMEIAYTGAEDPFLPNGKFSTGISLGAGSVDNSIAHTGSKSISLTAGATGVTYQVALGDLDPSRRDYQIAVWVKSAGDVSTARLFYQIDNQSVQLNAPSFQKSAAGWYLLEMRVPASALASGTNLTVGCKNTGGQSAINFDDFRFQPFNAPTTSYVYDTFTGELTHILDNNNLFVKYEYDATGRLVKVYKEVLGKSTIPVIKEIAYNYAKPIATVDNSGSFYARVEMSNYSSTVSNDEYNTEQLHADVYVKFYLDANCTVPYTLPVAMDFDVATLTTWNDFWGSGSYPGSYIYGVPEGSSYFFIGNMEVSTQRYWYDNYYGDMWENTSINYSIAPYMNSPYIALPTI